MKAVYIGEFGDLENLEVREVPDLSDPEGSEIVVRVYAAGLNRADLLQVKGLYPPPAGYSPNIPGLEFAGEISAVGSNVTRWKTGDRVFGITAGEGQAEFLKTHESLLAAIPDDLDYAHAAAVPEAFITAHDAIVTQGNLKDGETVLIHAVGSGVGLAGLQIAKARGSRVIGTSRTPDKIERCKQEIGLDLGLVIEDPTSFADRVTDLNGDKGVDVILDLVGGAYFGENLNSLANKGRLVLVGLTSGREAKIDLGLALRKRARIIGTVLRGRSTGEKAEATRRFADDLLPLFASGEIKPTLDRSFPAAEAVDAYKYLASNKSFGKVVLEFKS